MDEATKQALAEFVQKALAATERAGEFAVEQAPLVVQEYIERGMFSALFIAAVALIGAGIAAFAFRAASRIEDDDLSIPTRLVCAGGVGCGFLIAIVNAHAALMIYIAPRVYIIEQLKGLL